jgi:hypothetical protein
MDNSSAVVAGLVIFVIYIAAILSSEDGKLSKWWILAIVGFFIVSSYMINEEEKDYKNFTHSFRHGKEIICRGGLREEYLVSKENNWREDGDFYIKEDLRIRKSHCKPKEQ